jgi:hypothetical protein
MSDSQQFLSTLVFAGVAVSLVLTLVLNGVTLLLINMLRVSVDALKDTVAQQTRLIEYLGRERRCA